MIVCSFFQAVFIAASAQSTLFSQYNGALCTINPAYNAHADKDQVSFIGRNQWPGYRLGYFSSAAAFNKFFPRINSSFGILGEKSRAHNGSFEKQKEGIQYGYRLLFFQRLYLCLGGELDHESSVIDVNNYYYRFAPKQHFTDAPVKKVSGESLTASPGIILFDADQKQYIGFSWKEIPVRSMKSDTLPLLQYDRGYSIQAMKKLTLSRYSGAFIYFQLNKNGRIAYAESDSHTVTIEPETFTYFLQLNWFFNGNTLLGAGYKLLPGNYGSTNLRFAIMPKVLGNFMSIGYSFDTKAYIQYDKIHFISSHEFYVKYDLPTKRR